MDNIQREDRNKENNIVEFAVILKVNICTMEVIGADEIEVNMAKYITYQLQPRQE